MTPAERLPVIRSSSRSAIVARELPMNRIAKAWRWLLMLIRHRSMELRLGLRVSIAAVLSFALSHWLNLPLSLWTVLTTVILTQMNVGRSLKATIDYMVGTLGGAAYSGAIAVLVPHDNELALLMVLAIGISPLAILAAIDPRFSAAPFTAVLVLLAPTIAHVSPLQSAEYRVIEVALGAVTGLAVSLIVLPARAQALALEGAGRMLDLMTQLMPELFKGFAEELDAPEILRIQDSVGRALAQLDALAAEAQRERMTSFVAAPDPGPLLRALLRLQHDLLMIGRAAAAPLPEPLRARLAPSLARISETADIYLRQSSAALLSRHDPPRLEPFEAALDSYLTAIADVRHPRSTCDLPVDTMERIFALAFALEQLHGNFGDLARVVRDIAQSFKATGRRAKSS
jgi:uncharacterized membrane protein YccC